MHSKTARALFALALLASFVSACPDDAPEVGDDAGVSVDMTVAADMDVTADMSATPSDFGYVLVAGACAPRWVQDAYVEASNTGAGDQFGNSVSLSADGSRLAVGAFNEDSNATGVGGGQANDSASNAGAVYVFDRRE